MCYCVQLQCDIFYVWLSLKSLLFSNKKEKENEPGKEGGGENGSRERGNYNHDIFIVWEKNLFSIKEKNWKKIDYSMLIEICYLTWNKGK